MAMHLAVTQDYVGSTPTAPAILPKVVHLQARAVRKGTNGVISLGA